MAVYEQIGHTLKELGSSWHNILLLSCYVKKLDWFDTVHKIFQQKTGNRPLLIDVATADAYAQPEMLLEVEATAYIP